MGHSFFRKKKKKKKNDHRVVKTQNKRFATLVHHNYNVVEGKLITKGGDGI
ncbi:hypothetical protein HanPI659440_Chr13g0505111 [Helianthus annuus]|nr:hypothetical protein HanPI659440_Chr13g0505111 [Helianthus annuus]